MRRDTGRSVNPYEANLNRAGLTDARLKAANLRDANMSRANLRDADLTNMPSWTR